MPDASSDLSLRIHSSIEQIAPTAWDACAGMADPFVSHAFLAALERSGSVSAKTGWLPQHLALYESGSLVGCAPVYLKSHSYGEYVFDWAWADAFERAGGRYYPKLQCAIPFTPVPGSRLLVRDDATGNVRAVLASGMLDHARRLGVSSLHVTFLTAAERDLLQSLGFLPRTGYQFHWQNRGYPSFAAFLEACTSRRRKAIHKERSALVDQGLRIQRLRGGEIGPRHWNCFHRFYIDTVRRKGAYAYLNGSFFEQLGHVLSDRLLLVWAETGEGRPVGAALNLVGDDAVYGRYWGCDNQIPFLHFELCYYQAIEFAIEQGLSRVEAGAQGEHKIPRGYLPVATHSVHWLAHPGLRQAVDRHLAAEGDHVAREIAQLASLAPFRHAGGGYSDAHDGTLEL